MLDADEMRASRLELGRVDRIYIRQSAIAAALTHSCFSPFIRRSIDPEPT